MGFLKFPVFLGPRTVLGRSKTVGFVGVIIQIIHIFLTCLIRNPQIRIQLFQTVTKSHHTHSTTQYNGRTGRYKGIAFEYLRKRSIHSFSNAAMLPDSQWSQIPAMSFRLFPYLEQTPVGIFTQTGKRMCTMRLFKQVYQPFIITVANQVTGTMPSVMTDIKRLISLRRFSLWREIQRICPIDSSRLLRSSKHLFFGCLCPKRSTAQHHQTT